MDRHGIQGVALQRNGLVGLGPGRVAVTVFKVKLRHQFMRLGQLRIERNRLGAVFCGMSVETVRGNHRQAEIRAGIRWILLKRLAEQTRRVGAVEALEEKPAPANFVKRLAAGRLRGQSELLIGALPLFQSPESLCAEVSIAALRQRFKAGLRLAAMPVPAQLPAIGGRGGLRECRADQQENGDCAGAPHLSNSSCTFANCTSAWVISFLYSAGSMAAFRYFNESIFCSSSSFWSSIERFAGSFAASLVLPRRRRVKFDINVPCPSPAARTGCPAPVSLKTACSVARRFCDS